MRINTAVCLLFLIQASTSSLPFNCRDISTPDKERYLIQPSPVQFTIEPQDLVFFNGSDITLHCETNCIQLGLNNLSCAVGFLHNGDNLDYYEPFDRNLPSDIMIGRRTLTILNANSNAIGQYQCFTNSRVTSRLALNDRIIGRPVHLQIAALEPVGEEIQRVNVSEGGNIELPCMKGIFPNPSSISWWRNGDRCDSLQQCLENIEIMPSGGLALTNITVNVSGDLFFCQIGWRDHHRTYNATYQITVNTMNSTTINVITPTIKPESPAIVFLNATVDYVSEGSVVYYKSDMLVDLQNVDDYLINITVTCTFSGHPRPRVKWFLNGLNVSECIDATNIMTEGNTSILYLSTTNSKSFFGSYQCVLDNEAGYVSNTTRILPKGWSNPPEIFSAGFSGTNLTIRWRPPDYTGGAAVNLYRVEFENLFVKNGKLITFDSKLPSESYTIQSVDYYYGLNGQFEFQVMIKVVNSDRVAISDAAVIRIDSQYGELFPKIRQINCLKNNVMVTWANRNQNAYSNIWDHCVHYNCSTPGGDVTGSACKPQYSVGRNNVLHSLELNDVPLNGNCTFRVLVFTNRYKYQYSNNKTCTRDLSSTVVISKMMDQTLTRGAEATFVCQATSEPISNIIHWNFNGIPINESDKYRKSTELLNYTATDNTLTVMSIESSDVGTYTCSVSNGRSADTSSGVLSVNEEPVIISTLEQGFNGTENDIITCTATGFPPPDIEWLNNDGSVVDKNRTKTLMATGVGNLFNVSVSMTIGRNDAGVYTCTANNSIGNDSRNFDISYITSIPVIIITASIDKEVYEYKSKVYNITENGSITCTATGYPPPNIEWQNSDGSVVDKNRTKTQMATGVGNLFNVSVSMTIGRNDAGVYTCTANNSIGYDKWNISITSSPIIIIAPGDKVVYEDKSKAYNINENGSIACTATGYPRPHIEWLDNNGSVVDKNRTKAHGAMATGVGNLFNVSVSLTIGRNDAGVYTCTANNSIGNDSCSINISVTWNNDGNGGSNSYVVIGGTVGVIFMIIVILCILIPYMRRTYRKKPLHIYDTVTYTKTTSVNIQQGPIYDTIKDENVDYLIEEDSVLSTICAESALSCSGTGEEPVQSNEFIHRSDLEEIEDRVTTFSVGFEAKSQQLSQQYNPCCMHDSSTQLHYNTITGNVKEDNVQIDSTVDQSHNTNMVHSLTDDVATSTNEGEGEHDWLPNDNLKFDITVDQTRSAQKSCLSLFPIITNSTEPTDEGKYGIISQPKCNDFIIGTIVDPITNKTKLAGESNYGIINQPKCDDFDIDTTVADQNHLTKMQYLPITNGTKLAGESSYGVINQPKCDDFDIDDVDQNHTTKTHLPPITNSIKPGGESNYGVINQPKCDYPNLDTVVDQNHATKTRSSPIASSTKLGGESNYGVINQPKCDDPNLDIFVDQNHATKAYSSPITNSTKPGGESNYGVINQPKCDDPNLDIFVDQNHATKAYSSPITNSAKPGGESNYGVINQPKCDDSDLETFVDQNHMAIIS